MSSSTELQAWLNGVVDGGPESDGRYPLTYADGLTYLVYCPAAQALNPALTEQPIEVFSNTAANAAATATVEAEEAEQASIDAQTYAANALAYRNTAQTHAASAANSAVNAALSETTALDHLGSAETAADNASYSAGEAAASATAASGSATAADASADAAAVSAADAAAASAGTAHLAGTETFTGVKTFASQVTITHAFPLVSFNPSNAGRVGYTGAWGDTAYLAVYEVPGGVNTKILSAHYTNGLKWDNNAVWHAGNFTPADKLDASEVTTSGTALTVAKRDSNGDLHTARLFRCSFGDQATISGAMAYRVSNGADNYIRFCDSPSAVRTWMGVPATAHTHTMANITDLPAISDAASNSTIVQRTAGGYIYCNHLNLSGPIYSSRPTNVIMEIGDGFIRRQALATFKNNIGIWVQAADPGASAVDGDLWIW